ncbi:hypothetical protein ES731_02690 [Psychroflexus gondwanensis]|jgi:uncharacterized membrane protein|uniref:Tic20 superfamily protein n=1 Tax=Psychroflexus gondwanensis ACAM 44 TaxID=1189619 RepID=N1WWL8_9FLAO|nr:hypothetical protein [Psychroflexus gondwanensis]EMY81582.1 hypothetical protein pgond44_07015 [Psychroflexus gondwanensis ACAM 44]TXE20951.1 hypothetical protein ES731_02690 [Psychroflexus gondwanensis]
MKNKPERSGKTAAIVAYFTIFGSILALFLNSDENKQEFASFHIRQALGINFLIILFGVVVNGLYDSFSDLSNIIVGSAFYLSYFILWIYGFVGAVSGKENKVPLIGNLCQRIFKKLT